MFSVYSFIVNKIKTSIPTKKFPNKNNIILSFSKIDLKLSKRYKEVTVNSEKNIVDKTRLTLFNSIKHFCNLLVKPPSSFK